jgi:hypothetical protein
MTRNHRVWKLLAAILVALAAAPARPAVAFDALPSWADSAPRRAIVAFVEKVTATLSPDFVPPSERIAVLDNDGTLWVEQPMYVQLAFALDRVRAMSPGRPEWKEREPFKSVLAGDIAAVLAGGEHAIAEIVMATHSGITTDEFERIVKDWIATARHPKTGMLYTEMAYQPMRELLAYLRANGFRTYIVSGGGVEFMRPWTEQVYGIPPDQVIGSSIRTRFELRDGAPVLVRLPEMEFVNDKAGKPVGIHKFIGRRPIAAFGNSDGDLQMLQWICGTPGPRFCLYVHHTDAVREYAYDLASSIGRLDEGLREAARRDWTVVDMKSDWKRVFAYER